MSRGQRVHDECSNIRTQLIVHDAQFHLLRGSLQVLAYLETDPYLEHGCVALAYAFEERGAAALGTELAEDWESAMKGMSIQMEGLTSEKRAAYLLNRSRLGSRLLPIPSSRRMLMTTFTKSPSMRT